MFVYLYVFLCMCVSKDLFLLGSLLHLHPCRPLIKQHHIYLCVCVCVCVCVVIILRGRQNQHTPHSSPTPPQPPPLPTVAFPQRFAVIFAPAGTQKHTQSLTYAPPRPRTLSPNIHALLPSPLRGQRGVVFASHETRLKKRSMCIHTDTRFKDLICEDPS